MNKEQKQFCKDNKITENQFFGKDKIGGYLYLRGDLKSKVTINRPKVNYRAEVQSKLTIHFNTALSWQSEKQ